MRNAVDLNRLEGFSDGTPEGVRQIVELFVEESRDTVAAMTVAFGESDRSALTTLAHRLGGSCAAVGAAPLAARLFELEMSGRTVSHEELASVMDGVEHEFEETMRFLTAYLEGQTR